MIRFDEPQDAVDLMDRLDGLRKVLRCAEVATYAAREADERDAIGWTLYVCSREAEDIGARLADIRKRDLHQCAPSAAR